MGFLTGPEIIRQVQLGNIAIDPFNEYHVGPNSVDLCLGDRLGYYLGGPEQMPYLDSRRENRLEVISIPPEGIVLEQNQLYLAETKEWTECGPFVPMINGRSSVGRLGTTVHVTAGWGETHFVGKWVLEIVVIHRLPVKLYPGDRVCALFFAEAVGEVVPYAGRYQRQQGVTGCRHWQDFLSKGA